MLFPSFSQCLFTSAVFLPAVSAQAGALEGLSQYLLPSRWVAKITSMVPAPCSASNNIFCIPPSAISGPQQTASMAWKEFSNANPARVITSSYRRARGLLPAQLGARAMRPALAMNHGHDWVGFIEMELADGTRAFCRGSPGKRGLYCWDTESWQVSSHFRLLHDKETDASAAAAAVGSGGNTCGKSSAFWVGSAPSSCASC